VAGQQVVKDSERLDGPSPGEKLLGPTQ